MCVCVGGWVCARVCGCMRESFVHVSLTFACVFLSFLLEPAIFPSWNLQFLVPQWVVGPVGALDKLCSGTRRLAINKNN